MEATYAILVVDLSELTVQVQLKEVNPLWGQAYCKGFNADEAERPTGLWAVAVPDTTKSTIKRRSRSPLAVH